jgi:hypothetical protein
VPPSPAPALRLARRVRPSMGRLIEAAGTPRSTGDDVMSGEHPAPDPAEIDRRLSAARPYRDLCSTCNHAETCGRPSTPERPIFFCELFEAFVPVSATAAKAAAPKSQAGRPAATGLKGLCMNCQKGQTCAIPKPDSGIWHCEEYR